MRVGYVLDSFPELSQTFVTNEIKELRATGAEVTIVTTRPPSSPADQDAAFCLKDVTEAQWRSARRHWMRHHPLRFARFRTRVANLQLRERGVEPRFTWQAMLAAALHLESARVQHLHAHFAWDGAAAAFCIAPLLGIPWSVTLHANDIFAERRNLQLKLRTADRLVTVCDYNLDFLRSELGLTRDVDMVICGVELPSQPATRTEPAIDVIAVGRLVEKKGFDLLIRAAADLVTRGRPVHVTIVGLGPELDALRDLASSLEVTDWITFAGALAHDDALKLVSTSRLFALPARVASTGDRDSMPVVIKEAMALGIPVIGTAVAAIPEMIDEEVGRLIPAEDPAALGQAIDELMSLSATEQRAIGTRGRNRVAQRFQLQAEVAKLTHVFDRATAHLKQS